MSQQFNYSFWHILACYGTPNNSNCNQWDNDQTACESHINHYNDCTFSNNPPSGYYCRYCQGLDEAGCAQAGGQCDWTEIDGCSSVDPQPNPCSDFDFTDQATCEAEQGCAWNGDDSTCGGSPVDCNSLGDEFDCNYSNCIWFASVPAHTSCSGTLICSDNNDSAACAFIAGCSWH